MTHMYFATILKTNATYSTENTFHPHQQFSHYELYTVRINLELRKDEETLGCLAFSVGTLLLLCARGDDQRYTLYSVD